MTMTFQPRHCLVAAAAALCCTLAQAQLIDQFDVRREGNDAVLQLRFATEVQFQRAVTTRAGDLTLIDYNLVTTVNSQVRATQGMQLGRLQGLPRMTLADEAVSGQRARRMVLRTAEPVTLEVRAGAGNRSIEVVLRGAGAAVTASTTGRDTSPATLPLAERRFAIVLQSAADPASALPGRIPRDLQNYEVFTRDILVDGLRRYETLIGHFATRTQAEAVLRQLAGFPQAAIVATGAAAPAVTAAPAVAAAPQGAAPASRAPVPEPTVAPAPVAPAPGSSAATPAPAPAGGAPATGVPEPAPMTAAETDARADALLAQAQALIDQGQPAAALGPLGELLNLPPNRRTQTAQEMAGMARVRSGDLARARIEFETYLQLYPTGEGADRVRRELTALPAAQAPVAASPRTAVAETTVTGSASMTYFGGNGQVRSQDFRDSPVAGLPQVAGDPLLSDDKARQLLSDVDLTWRHRNAEQDIRFVFRDSYTNDLERPEKNRNRLSALYVDYKSLTGGYGVRLGRQSPTGGGVMGRFDGISANVQLKPRLKLGGVAGSPTDKFFDSKRHFYGVSLDADGWLPNFGSAVYVIEQKIDKEVDRRGIGLEMRYFKGGASVFSQLDYDALIKGLNIATVQGTVVLEDNTVFNALYDRRALTMLALGNSLTFEDPSNPGVLFSRIADKLATTTLEALRDQIRRTTPFVTQAQVGVTRPLSKTWQVGASAALTNTGAIPPVPEVVGFENGRPTTGNIYSVSAQLIGLNLYSSRDTHVFSSTAISSPQLKGFLMGYNNSSIAWNVWQMEPSVQFYRDRTPEGSTSQRWTPGLRVTYRGWERWALESYLTYELGRASRVTPDPNDPTINVTTKESSTRVNYSLGARYTF